MRSSSDKAKVGSEKSESASSKLKSISDKSKSGSEKSEVGSDKARSSKTTSASDRSQCRSDRDKPKSSKSQPAVNKPHAVRGSLKLSNDLQVGGTSRPQTAEDKQARGKASGKIQVIPALELKPRKRGTGPHSSVSVTVGYGSAVTRTGDSGKGTVTGNVTHTVTTVADNNNTARAFKVPRKINPVKAKAASGRAPDSVTPCSHGNYRVGASVSGSRPATDTAGSSTKSDSRPPTDIFRLLNLSSQVEAVSTLGGGVGGWSNTYSSGGGYYKGNVALGNVCRMNLYIGTLV